jgi:hypothetical protein
MNEKYIFREKPCSKKLSNRLDQNCGKTCTFYCSGRYFRKNGQWVKEIRVKNPDYDNSFVTYCVIPSDERQNMEFFFIQLRLDSPKKKWYPAVHKAMKMLGAKNNLRFLDLEGTDIPEEKIKQKYPLFILQDSGEVVRLNP